MFDTFILFAAGTLVAAISVAIAIVVGNMINDDDDWTDGMSF